MITKKKSKIRPETKNSNKKVNQSRKTNQYWSKPSTSLKKI